jgi:hypothetical protein
LIKKKVHDTVFCILSNQLIKAFFKKMGGAHEKISISYYLSCGFLSVGEQCHM